MGLAEIAIREQVGLLAYPPPAFVNQQRFTTSNIIGATTLEQLRTNIASIEVTLDRDLLRAVNAIHQRHPNPAP